jgi:hypothetical protein
MCIFAGMIPYRNLFLFFLFTGVSFLANAQRPYFVYLQTETQEPFFVQLNKKNQSSSAAGHLILSGLVNGKYDISIGFPGQNAAQQYTLTIEGADKGYLVKKFENGEWGLVDLQTSEAQISGAVKRAAEKAEIDLAIAAAAAKKQEEEQALKAEQEKAEQAKAEQEKAEQAKAEQVKAEQEKAEQAKAEQAKAEQAKAEQAKAEKDKADAEKASGNNNGGAKVAAAAVTTAAVVTQSDEKKEVTEEVKVTEKTAEKTGETAEKQASGTANTPAASKENAVAAPAAVAAGTLSAAEIAKLQEEARRIDAQGKRDSVLKAQKKDTAEAKQASAAPAFLDIEMTMPADSLKENTDTAVVAPVVVQPTPPDSSKAEAAPAKNPNCTAEATDADIDMVTMLIKGEKAADDALEMARKGMKIKCVQTAQVRKLALLFEGQEDRYRLLDMAYRYTIDRQNYLSLADLLTDTYFLNRFKAMLQ